MAKFAKWIGGSLGWAFFGPIGGILGFALGSIIDSDEVQKRTSTGSRSHFSGKARTTTTGDFVLSLLILTATVMKADGRVLKSELDYVKEYFVQTFGIAAAKEAMLMLRDLLKKRIPVEGITAQIKQNLDYSSRLQLLHFLYGISKADGKVNKSELEVIELIAFRIGINQRDKESIKSMFYMSADRHGRYVDSAYKVLEIAQNATDDEVKKAYRKMAVKYHPDKVSYLGEDFQRIAKDKFQKVNEAFKKIKKERMMA